MSNVFLDYTTEGGGVELNDGTVPIFVSTVRSSALEPNKVVRTNGTKGLISGDIFTTDVRGLQDALEEKADKSYVDSEIQPLESRVGDAEGKTRGLTNISRNLTFDSGVDAGYIRVVTGTTDDYGGFQVVTEGNVVGGLIRRADDLVLYGSFPSTTYALRIPVGTREAILYDPRSEKEVEDIKEGDQLTTKEYVDSEIQPLDSRLEVVEDKTEGLEISSGGNYRTITYDGDHEHSYIQAAVRSGKRGGFRFITEGEVNGGLIKNDNDLMLYGTPGSQNFAVRIPINTRVAYLYDPRSMRTLAEFNSAPNNALTTKEYVNSVIQPLDSRLEDVEEKTGLLSISSSNPVFTILDGSLRITGAAYSGGATSLNRLQTRTQVENLISTAISEIPEVDLSPLENRVETVETLTAGFSNADENHLQINRNVTLRGDTVIIAPDDPGVDLPLYIGS